MQEGAWPGGGRAAGLDAAAGIGARRSAGWRAERPWPGPQRGRADERGAGSPWPGAHRGRADERGARRLCPGAQRPGGRVRAASRLGAVLAGAKAEGRRCVRARRRRLAMEVRSNGLVAGWVVRKTTALSGSYVGLATGKRRQRLSLTGEKGIHGHSALQERRS